MKIYSPHDIVSAGLCIGCGICVANSRRTDTFMKFDKYGQLKPHGPQDWMKNRSADFTATCPFSPGAINEDKLADMLYTGSDQRHDSIGRYLANYVGYVNEENFREQGSSGGMVSWVAVNLLKKGLVDGIAHVVATEDPGKEKRFFRFRVSRTEAEIREGAKSRYYPVELSSVLDQIRTIPGRYAVVAIPCMIKAIHLLRKKDPVFRERICFTLGVFCGHMKSAGFVESIAWQMRIPVSEINKVEFRQKIPDRPANWYNAMLRLNNGQTVNKDWWHLKDGDWGAGFFMSNACNYCDDVVAETADISFGDAWVEPYASDGMGTNVIVVRSPVIHSMIIDGISGNKLKLREVTAGLVEQTQAAGLRQRREGLAYRLKWVPPEIPLIKRVKPGAVVPSKSRMFIYRFRYWISMWSHRFLWLARKLKLPFIYLVWARIITSVYYGYAYHQGNWTKIKGRYKGFGKT